MISMDCKVQSQSKIKNLSYSFKQVLRAIWVVLRNVSFFKFDTPDPAITLFKLDR